MMQASYSGTTKHNQNVAVLPQDNPNADFNQSDDNLEWISEDLGQLPIPWTASMTSALYEARSGEPWAAHGAVLRRHDDPDPGDERRTDRFALLPDGGPP